MYDPYEGMEEDVNVLSDEAKQVLDDNVAASTAQVKANEALMPQAPQTGEQQSESPKTEASAEGTPAPQTKQEQQAQQATVQEPVDEPDDLGDHLRNIAEGGFAAQAGFLDWGIDVVNHIPGVNIPKIPKYQNKMIQAGRELASIIVPTILLQRGGNSLGKMANSRVGWKLGQNELVKFIGEAGVAAGTGAFVDATNKLNEKDDNFQGSIKKMFPKHTQWISNDWATLDSDSPEVKRAKNINEGVGLGIFADFLVGFAKLIRARKGIKESVKYIPENETARAHIKKMEKPSGTPEDEVLKSMNARETARDDLGAYRMSKQIDMDKPFDKAIFGIHNAFDVTEEGIRSVDGTGVMGAAVDYVRIRDNLGSHYGRLGSIISESALKKGLKANSMRARDLVNAVTDQIKSAGNFGYRYAGGKIPFSVIDKAGTELAEVILDPRMDTGTIKAVLDNYMDSIRGTKTLDDVGYNAAFKAIKGYMDEFMNMDTLKAQAYLQTSIAGQVSDMAEGARIMDGTAAIERAQEQILDRLEFLMVEKGLSSYLKGSALNYLNVWKRLFYSVTNPKTIEELAYAAREEAGETIDSLVDRAKRAVDTYRHISKERPEFLKPFALAYEFTDGNVDSMSKLNNYIEQSTGVVRKAFIDDQPEIPSVVVQGMWANIYNSVLTSISTPMKAGLGNLALLIEKPITVLGGALISGDTKTLRRGWYQYSAMFDSMRKGMQHANLVYKKASMDPNSVSYIMRDDIVIKNEKQMRILKSYAEAAESRGDFGPMVIYQQAETMQEIANNPFLRFGANAMSAMDGWARAMIANAEVRGKMYDRFVADGRKVDADLLRQIEDATYNEMFDSTGMITDSAVEHASREIAMNLDNPAVDAMSAFIARFPVVKPFMMFPRTSANIISMADKHSPISVFSRELNTIANPLKRIEDFSVDEMKQILETRGIKTTDETLVPEFARLRAEIRGRKAIGTGAIMLAGGMFMNDSLRGNGHYDQNRQRVRQQLGWKPRTFKGWDGNWYSYEGMGPISDWLATVADAMDNFDTIEEQDLSTFFQKMAYVIGANLTNKSMLAGIEPLNDVLAGNPAAMNRWAASFTSSLMPLSGARNELGRLLAPQLRELDMDLIQLLRNRNKWTDAIDPNSKLPDAYDWIDGDLIGYSDNFFVRAWNAVMPMKMHGKISDERQFLIDIEYDTRPTFAKSSDGVEYTPEERSELFNLIGKHKFFKSRITEIMNGVEAKEWRKSIKAAREGNARVDPAKWMNLYNRLDVALDIAKKNAEAYLSPELKSAVLRRRYEQGLNERLQLEGKTYDATTMTNK